MEVRYCMLSRLYCTTGDPNKTSSPPDLDQVNILVVYCVYVEFV